MSISRRLARWPLAIVAVACAIPFASAATKYVTPAGAPPFDGNDWTSAYSSVQDAVTACAAESSTIYIQTGRYAISAPILVLNAADLTLRGGCTGSGTATTTNDPTVIYRNGAAGNIKLLAATNSTVTFEGLTFTNGFARDGSITRGFAVNLVNSRTTFTNCVLRDNRSNAASDSGQYGTAIYAQGGALVLRDTLLLNNLDAEGYSQYGGAIYATAVAVTSVNSRFVGNTTQGNNSWGAGLYLSACTNAWIETCSFVSNVSYRMGGNGSGAAIYASVSPNLVVTNCHFAGNLSDLRGSAITLTGNGQTARIVDSTIRSNFFLFSTTYSFGTEDVYVNTTNNVTLANTVIGNGGRHGIYLDVAGNLSLSNCLIAATPGHGIWATAGGVTLAGCTIADNAFWGVTNGSGTVAIRDSILWGNGTGGVPTNRLTMDTTCAQEDHAAAGSGNLTSDPLLIAGYYLSKAGLPRQAADSPCLDAGGASAAERGQDLRTTRTDGELDTGTADLGYHAAAAFAEDLNNLELYVDAASGSDASNGWSQGSGALRTITAALGRAIDGSTIRLAAGTYSTNSGERFPLVIGDNNLTLAGTNRDATVIHAGGSAVAQRALYSAARGRLRLEGLTLTNGYSSAYARLGDGGGLYILSGQTLLTNCLVTGNQISYTVSDTATFGCGLYAQYGAVTVVDSVFERNAGADSRTRSGGGLYANAVALVLRRVTVRNNSINANNASAGAGVYLNGGSAWIEGCAFQTNLFTVNNGGHLGGGLCAVSTTPLTITNCAFAGNGVRTGTGSALALSGAGMRAAILDCRILNNAVSGSAGDDAYLNGVGYALFRDTVIASGARHGIQQAGAASVLALTNCLVSYQPGHGILVAAGTAYVQNVTSAGHTLAGLTNTAGTVTLRDSIFWGSAAGGVRGAGAVAASFVDSQESLGGTSNQVADPLFTSGFYLGDGSPCIDAGSTTADALGMGARSTRTDGAPDSGTVDLGYHYEATGSSEISNAFLYVDAVNGSDSNNGWSWGAPLKTITAALGKAIDGSVIRIASGTYSTNSGESFPLTIQDNGLSFLGSNRIDTIVNGGQVDQIFVAVSRGALWFEGLTVTNGYAYRKRGGGFSVTGCQLTLTNCAVLGNRMGSDAEYIGDRGAGVYALNGSLAVVDCDVLDQYNTDPFYKYGGGVYAENAAVTIRRTRFLRNRLGSSNPSLGGGLCLVGGSAWIEGCEFGTNRTDYGGGLYASGVAPLAITGCVFRGNGPQRAGQSGGALSLEGGTAALVVDTDFVLNTNAYGVDTIRMASSGAARFVLSTLASNSGPGFVASGSGALAVTNCLVYAQSNHAIQASAGTVSVGNSTLAHNGGWGATNAGGTVTLVNSVVWGNALGGLSGCTASYSDSQEAQAGAGNRNLDPLFKSPAGGDFALKNGSPCINAGTNEPWMATAVDLAGNARRRGGTVDMGAYEAFGADGTVFFLR